MGDAGNVTMLKPMVDDDVDLRNYDFMPLKVRQLRDSDLAAEAEPEAFRAAVLLWSASWHEVPAASLPDDDRKLCRLAGLHRDLETWSRVKSEALHGFELCSDGRYYHPLIADLANEAWVKKKRNAARTANATLARQRKRGGLMVRDGDRNDPKNPTKGQGEGQGEQGIGNREASPPRARDEADTAVSMWNRMAEKWKLPKALTKLSDTRRTKIIARLDDLDGLDGWAIVLQKVSESPLLRGEKRDWHATLDWCLEPRNLTKIMEGNYAARPNADRKSGFAGFTEAYARGDFEGGESSGTGGQG